MNEPRIKPERKAEDMAVAATMIRLPSQAVRGKLGRAEVVED